MKNEKGFTLIELLVVIAIIGILAAIAIPQFAEYKTRAFNSRAQSDLRNGLTAQEAYFVDQEEYLACAGDACVGDTGLPGFVISENVQIEYTTNAALTEFGGGSCHERGDKSFTWTSNSGDPDTDGKVQSANAADCSGPPAMPTVN